MVLHGSPMVLFSNHSPISSNGSPFSIYVSLLTFLNREDTKTPIKIINKFRAFGIGGEPEVSLLTFLNREDTKTPIKSINKIRALAT